MTWNDLYDYNNKCKDYDKDKRILDLARSSIIRDTLKVSNKIQSLMCAKCKYLLDIEKLQRLYKSLSIEVQQIIRMRYKHKMSNPVIAKGLGISLRTVCRRIEYIDYKIKYI